MVVVLPSGISNQNSDPRTFAYRDRCLDHSVKSLSTFPFDMDLAPGGYLCPCRLLQSSTNRYSTSAPDLSIALRRRGSGGGISNHATQSTSDPSRLRSLVSC